MSELIIQVRLIERRAVGNKKKPYTIEKTLDRRDLGTVPTTGEGEGVLALITMDYDKRKTNA